MVPSTVPGIPRRVADLDARVFCALTSRIDVTAVQINDVEHGTSIRARINITGSPDLPRHAFVKLAPTRPAEYLLNRYMGLAHTEAGIYRRLNTELDGIVPEVFGTQSDPRGGRAVVIMEDLTDGNARFLSVAAGCTAADALAVAATLGSLHRRFWMSERLHTGDLIDLSPALSRSTSRGPRAWPLLRMIPRMFHDVVPLDFRAEAAILVTQRRLIAKLIGTYPHTLIHGDTHAGNICVIGDRPVLFDWQVAACGPAVKDLSYFACTSIDTDTRRDIDARLVETYIGELNADGIERLSLAEAWDAYRMFAFTAYIAAGVTSVFGRRLQGEETTRAGLQRAVQAVRDFNSLAMLRKKLASPTIDR
jgi:hypothetical protein